MRKIKKTLIVLIILYLFSYFILSRAGMNDAIIGSNEDGEIWPFNGLRQRIEKYYDPSSREYKSEVRLRLIYWPLIKVDKYIFNHYHIFEDDLPFTGG